MYKFVLFALIAIQLTASIASNTTLDEESAIQEALITLDKKSHAAYFTKLLQIIEKTEEADEVVFKISATSTVCSLKDEVIDVHTVKSICTEKMPLFECTITLQKPSLQYSAASCSEVDISSLPLKSVKSENAALVGSAMHSVEFALYKVDSERRSGFYKKFKDIIDVSQYGIMTVIEATAVETDCPVIDDSGIVDIEEECKDTDVSYECKFVYFYSYIYDASVDCVRVASDDSKHTDDEESAIQEALITLDKKSHAAYFTKLLQIIEKTEEADEVVFKISATSTVCSSKDEVIDVHTVKSICTEKMPLFECTITLQKPSLQYSAASCSEVDISSLPLKSVKSENAALVGSAMHSVEFALYKVDSERRSGFYKKFKDIIDVSQYGIVTVIEATAVETDCPVIDDDGIVDIEEECKDTDVSYKCKFVYFYSHIYDASVDCFRM
ncbi:Small ribosomal subunit protein uS4c [Trichinella pseudospiralis]